LGTIIPKKLPGAKIFPNNFELRPLNGVQVHQKVSPASLISSPESTSLAWPADPPGLVAPGLAPLPGRWICTELEAG
jgi:hypothetical protein